MAESTTYDSLAGVTRTAPKTDGERVASICTLAKFIEEQQVGSSMFRIGQIGLTLGQEGGVGYARPYVTPERFTLETRGVFPVWHELVSSPFELGSQGQREFWGLINGQWYTLIVHWVIKKFEGTHNAWPHATLVDVSDKFSLEELLKLNLPDCNAKSIEYWLKEFIGRCLYVAQNRFGKLEEFASQFDAEERFWKKVARNAEVVAEEERRRRQMIAGERYGE